MLIRKYFILFLKRILNKIENKKYKDTFDRNDIHLFLKEFENRLKGNLQVNLLKPNVLTESGDIHFKNIEIYNKIEETISFKERKKFYDQIKFYHQKYINENIEDEFEVDKIQPITFGMWYLGTEIRIGTFINTELVEKMGIKKEEILERVKKEYNIFKSVKYNYEFNSAIRYEVDLYEVKISADQGVSILENQEFVDFASQLYANYTSNFVKYYFETTRNNNKDKNNKYICY